MPIYPFLVKNLTSKQKENHCASVMGYFLPAAKPHGKSNLRIRRGLEAHEIIRLHKWDL